MHILIIDDDRRLTRLIADVLTEEGMTCAVAFDGDTGLDLVLCVHFDVVLIDWMLPGRDGPTICRAIRAARLPMAILMLTARIQEEDRTYGLQSGADDYLVKPFTFDDLLARIRILSQSHQHRAVT
jgi:DNA-binding response OmpR family regulator